MICCKDYQISSVLVLFEFGFGFNPAQVHISSLVCQSLLGEEWDQGSDQVDTPHLPMPGCRARELLIREVF